MPNGRFTDITTKTTAALLAGSLVDPTLVCLTSALAVAPLAAGGLAYHGAKKGITSGKKVYREHKARKEAAKDISPTTSVELDPLELNPDLLVEYEACVRKVAAAATGVAIQGSMAAVMPHLSVVVVVNSVDLVTAVKQLRKLRKQDVHKAVSGMSITEHVVIGVVLKMLATGLTLGHGDLCAVDAFAADHIIGGGLSGQDFADKVAAIFGGHDSVGIHVEGGTDPTAAATAPVDTQMAEQSAVQMHRDMLQHHVIHEINAAANYIPDEVERYLGLGDEWRPDEFAATERHSGLTNIAIVGVAAGGMDVVISKVLEEPVHAAIDKAELWRYERRDVEGVARFIEKDMRKEKAQRIKRKAVPAAVLAAVLETVSATSHDAVLKE